MFNLEDYELVPRPNQLFAYIVLTNIKTKSSGMEYLFVQLSHQKFRCVSHYKYKHYNFHRQIIFSTALHIIFYDAISLDCFILSGENEITSPNYPSDYDPNTHVCWKFTADEGKVK